MLTRIDRYLLREITPTFFAAVLLLLAMVLSNKLADYLSRAAGGLLSQQAIWQLLGLQAIRYLVVLVPACLFLALMLSLGRLYRDNEMIALTACGVGPGRVYRTLLLPALLLAAAMAVMAIYVVPLAMQLQVKLQFQARQEAQVAVIRPGTFRELTGGHHVVYVGRELDGGRYGDIFVRSRDKSGFVVTMGESGHQELDTESGARYLVLENGWRYEGLAGGELRTLHFQRIALQMAPPSAEQAQLKLSALPTAQLWTAIEPALQGELQARFSSAIAVILITLLAPLLAHANPRQGRFGRVVAAILIYSIYLNLLKVAQSLIEDGKLAPGLGLWWVHGLLALLIAVLWLQRYGNPWGAAGRRVPS